MSTPFLVKDIFPGFYSSFPQNLTAVGNTLFFNAFDGVNGLELWKSDGTAAGRVLVADIRFGASGSYPRNLTVVDSTLYFRANDGVNNDELWALNVSTLAIPTLAIAATSANQTEGNSGSKAFTFTVTRAVNTTGSNNVNWAVTGSGTNPANATDFVGSVLPSGVVSFAAGETSKVITVNVQGDTTVELNETFTVTLSNPTNGATITTATATGTIQNDDVAIPTLAIAATSANQTEGNSGSKAFTFTVTRAVNTTGSNNVNWAVTGSGTNPANATDFVGSVLPSGVVSFAAGETSKVITVNVQGDTTVELNETFTVTLSNPTNGATLGTPSTATVTIVDDDSVPFLVKDIFPGLSGSSPGYLTVVGNTLFFRANDGVNGTELWKSDGTAAGTVLVKDIRLGSGGSDPGFLTAVGNTLFFRSLDGVNGQELWKSDGTAAGTVLVKDIRLGSGGSSPYYLTAVGNTLFFRSLDGFNGQELWKSDGTAAGTVLVKDIRPGSGGSDPGFLTAVGNTLFFRSLDGVNGQELWKSDGTAAGTVLVKDIRPGSGGSYPRYLTAVGNTLFFRSLDGVNGTELWKSDGTAAGTVLVKDIRPGSGGSYPRYLTAAGNTLFFRANDGVNGYELWKSDGTAAGTVLVKDIRPGASSSNLRNLTAVGNTLYFTADDGVNGYELWKSDGTAAGTVLVKDIRPGASSSNPQNLRVVGSTLYFTADDGVNGEELWKSDGTAAGTVLVGDIRPGSSGSNPQNLRVVGSTLYFTADDGVNGRELWALNVGTPAIPTLAIAATSANQTEGNSGSKAFTFTVTRAVNTTGSNNVNWAVTGSGTNPANATDFVGGVLPSGTVSFAAGETSKVITVNVQGDTTVELNETFTVTLSNATNGATITTATATGTINNDDFIGISGPDTLAGTSGADALTGLDGNDTYTVNDAGDLVIEALNQGTDTVQASISYTLPDNVENLLLTGTGNFNGTGNGLNNQITGNSGNNSLNGAAGIDTLTGGVGTDIFIFQFSQSTSTALDRVTDFAIGTDKIDLLSQAGAAINAPVAFTRAADSTTTNINTIVTNVFTDANGATAGNQALGINSAVLVRDNSSSTYLIINDGTAGFQSANDLVINLTGLTGTFPALGTIAVNSFFV
ncbi:ELWxxDGT repeat protein [Microcystis aeruginosa 1339]|uniref:ELWxxDGT repeat protein n=2 Tax=Microcystis aeruginosa TaxID=1126 RepID=UPI0031342336